MRTDKYNRMIATYDGFKGAQTVAHVLSTIPADLLARITGKQAGQIMNIRNGAYHEGVAVGEKHDNTDGCIYIDGVGLIPLEIIRKIKIEESTEQRDGQTWGTRKYALDATENW